MNSALSVKELHAPLFDDETGFQKHSLLERMQVSQVTLSNNIVTRLKLWGKMEKPPLCRLTACRR
eukprot:5212877-Amphidinium_carterae.1